MTAPASFFLSLLIYISTCHIHLAIWTTHLVLLVMKIYRFNYFHYVFAFIFFQLEKIDVY